MVKLVWLGKLVVTLQYLIVQLLGSYQLVSFQSEWDITCFRFEREGHPCVDSDRLYNVSHCIVFWNVDVLSSCTDC